MKYLKCAGKYLLIGIGFGIGWWAAFGCMLFLLPWE